MTSTRLSASPGLNAKYAIPLRDWQTCASVVFDSGSRSSLHCLYRSTCKVFITVPSCTVRILYANLESNFRWDCS